MGSRRARHTAIIVFFIFIRVGPHPHALTPLRTPSASSVDSRPRLSLSTERRSGQVHLQGRALADDAGPFNALGASLFWALWGERHDPDRLDANLRWLVAHEVDYVRILGMVGGQSWEDRRIDPASPDYWTTVDRLLARLARHGLRIQVALFAEADDMMPVPAARQQFVDAWAAKANEIPERFVFLEIANEHWKNGLSDVEELRALGRRLADRTGVLLALSAPTDGQACAVYAGSAADLATVHYGRSTSEGGVWQPVGQPWKWPGEYDAACKGRLPPAVNNEPIGPRSGGNEDDDPRRLVMAYITTFVAGNGAYVLHAGAGIRGGGAGDRSRGRAANLYDVPLLADTLAGVRAAKAYLPPGLANWQRAELPFEGFERALQDRSIAGAYASSLNDRFVAVVFGLRGPLTVRAKRGMVVTVHDPRTGAVVKRIELAAGQPLGLDGFDSFVLIGERGV